MLCVVPPHFLACPRERSTPREDARVSHTQLVNVIEYRLCTTSSRRRNGLTAPPGDMLFPDGDKQRLPLFCAGRQGPSKRPKMTTILNFVAHTGRLGPAWQSKTRPASSSTALNPRTVRHIPVTADGVEPSDRPPPFFHRKRRRLPSASSEKCERDTFPAVSCRAPHKVRQSVEKECTLLGTLPSEISFSINNRCHAPKQARHSAALRTQSLATGLRSWRGSPPRQPPHRDANANHPSRGARRCR